jgi:Outer membrane protein beta-barrel domain
MRHSFARKAAATMAVLAAMTFSAQAASAQAKGGGGGGFGLGYTDIGPAIGIGGIGNASASFGGRFEHAIKNLPDLGNGVLGIEASFDYYSWSNTFYSWKYVPVGVTANYHFKTSEPKFDPFLGAGLGYQIISCDFTGTVGNVCSNSAIYFIGRAGARYFFQPNMAGYVDVGAGAATFNLGLMFKVM